MPRAGRLSGGGGCDGQASATGANSRAAPDSDQSDGGESGRRAGERVDEIVVARRGHRDGHHEWMDDEECAEDAVGVARKPTIATRTLQPTCMLGIAA